MRNVAILVLALGVGLGAAGAACGGDQEPEGVPFPEAGVDAGEEATTPGCVPSAETCNGLDDDCNGVVDDLAQPAGNGSVDGRPAGCRIDGVGLCAFGVLRCGDAGALCVPMFAGGRPERCNGLDDDCNGMVDEGMANLGACRFDGGIGGCGLGRLSCAEGTPRCLAGAPVPEICNGIDDNCDGTIDEELAGPLCSPPGYCSPTGECAGYD